jgi:hypothetical protein
MAGHAGRAPGRARPRQSALACHAAGSARRGARFQQWRALPPERRALVRERLERFRALPPEQQREVRENFHRFQSLPPERRAMLRQRWQRATPAERQRMLDRTRARRSHPMMERRKD